MLFRARLTPYGLARVAEGVAYCHVDNDAHNNQQWALAASRAEALEEIAEIEKEKEIANTEG